MADLVHGQRDFRDVFLLHEGALDVDEVQRGRTGVTQGRAGRKGLGAACIEQLAIELDGAGPHGAKEDNLGFRMPEAGERRAPAGLDDAAELGLVPNHEGLVVPLGHGRPLLGVEDQRLVAPLLPFPDAETIGPGQ